MKRPFSRGVAAAMLLLTVGAVGRSADTGPPPSMLPPAGDSIAQGEATLKDVLEKVLRARRPEEFAFIARVVLLVDQQVLPLEMVQGTFNWARKKPRHPFQYFEQALRVRAKEIGVEL